MEFESFDFRVPGLAIQQDARPCGAIGFEVLLLDQPHLELPVERLPHILRPPYQHRPAFDWLLGLHDGIQAQKESKMSISISVAISV